MADILFLALIAGFFALALLLVRGCERLIGEVEPAADPVGASSAPVRERAAA
jgi:hypothetical protein